MRDLLAELNTAIDKGYACVYCSIIETRGSTPQKAGAGRGFPLTLVDPVEGNSFPPQTSDYPEAAVLG